MDEEEQISPYEMQELEQWHARWAKVAGSNDPLVCLIASLVGIISRFRDRGLAHHEIREKVIDSLRESGPTIEQHMISFMDFMLAEFSAAASVFEDIKFGSLHRAMQGLAVAAEGTESRAAIRGLWEAVTLVVMILRSRGLDDETIAIEIGGRVSDFAVERREVFRRPRTEFLQIAKRLVDEALAEE